MNCPKCGREMRQGWLFGFPLIWTTNKHLPGRLFAGKDDVFLRDHSTEESGKPPAWICEDCRVVMIDY